MQPVGAREAREPSARDMKSCRSRRATGRGAVAAALMVFRFHFFASSPRTRIAKVLETERLGPLELEPVGVLA